MSRYGPKIATFETLSRVCTGWHWTVLDDGIGFGHGLGRSTTVVGAFYCKMTFFVIFCKFFGLILPKFEGL